PPECGSHGAGDQGPDVALAEAKGPPWTQQLHDRDAALVGPLIERRRLYGEHGGGLADINETIGGSPRPVSRRLHRNALGHPQVHGGLPWVVMLRLLVAPTLAKPRGVGRRTRPKRPRRPNIHRGSSSAPTSVVIGRFGRIYSVPTLRGPASGDFAPNTSEPTL